MKQRNILTTIQFIICAIAGVTIGMLESNIGTRCYFYSGLLMGIILTEIQKYKSN